MKKLAYLFLAVGVMVLASCETAGKKSEGTYTGTHTIPGIGGASGTVVVTSSGDQAVNMNFVCSDAGMNTTANSVSATLSNNVVTYSFTGSGTNDFDITAVSGNLTNKTLTLSYSFAYMGGTVASTFSGTKP